MAQWLNKIYGSLTITVLSPTQTHIPGLTLTKLMTITYTRVQKNLLVNSYFYLFIVNDNFGLLCIYFCFLHVNFFGTPYLILMTSETPAGIKMSHRDSWPFQDSTLCAMITCTWTGTYGLMTSLLFSSGISHICSMQTRFKLEMEKEDKTFL